MTGRAPNHYIPNTDAERRDMLDVVGAASIDDLFLDIPQALRDPRLDLPTPMSELDLRREMAALAEENKHLEQRSSFLGGGAYNHFIPSVVRALITRGEFLTAYTPYQPEVSQGTLQATFDFQTLVCNLLEMEVADAGMYDGATALAEAALMACRITGRRYVAALNSTLTDLSAGGGDLYGATVHRGDGHRAGGRPCLRKRRVSWSNIPTSLATWKT